MTGTWLLVPGTWEDRREALRPEGDGRVNGIVYAVDESDLDLVVEALEGFKMIEPTIHYRLPKKQIDAIVRSIE